MRPETLKAIKKYVSTTTNMKVECFVDASALFALEYQERFEDFMADKGYVELVCSEGWLRKGDSVQAS